ncbi:MarR family winged helix-turn-helix transcriptional regulator [Metabacillus herbersteinensis]|uniref:MarR family winged helix-turn-helix transcriptional regulator n=1 Tax=Metabacillus herbersteinensis TaxID=283816 RepID=A0ABV6GGQ6_9BACI
MQQNNIEELVNRYLKYSYSVTKKAENLIREQIGEDMTNDQHYTLRYIKQTGVCTSTELAEAFEVKKSAITAIINRLVERELIKRTRDENDRRVVYLTLTEAGEELFLKTEQKIHKLVESFISQFETTEIEAFLNTFEKLNNILIDHKDCKMEE